MSLIVGQYYRGNPKQKPKQWGTFTQCSSIVKSRFEYIGINPKTVIGFWPFWSPGNQYNYADGTSSQAYNVTYQKKRILTTKSNYVDIGKDLSELGSNYTLLWRGQVNSQSISSFFCGQYINSSVGYDCGFYRSAISHIFSYYPTPGVYINFDVGLLNKDYCFSIVCDSSTCKSYVDGVYKNQINSTSSIGSTYNWSIGKGFNNATINSEHDFFIVINDNLDFYTIQKLYENLFNLVQPPTIRTYFDLAVTAGTAIDCMVGAVAVTGLPAAVTAGTAIDCAVGAVAVTGLAAAVTAGTSIDCAVGAVAVTGNHAEVSVGDNISCNTGIVNITGLQAAIQSSTSVDCSFGAVAITGLQATIAAGYTINCTAGTVGITGIAAGISAGTSIDCTFGAVAVTSLAASVISSSTIETPVTRQFVIKNENRLFTITNENRSFTIT